jgi:hypothetical protein
VVYCNNKLCNVRCPRCPAQLMFRIKSLHLKTNMTSM